MSRQRHLEPKTLFHSKLQIAHIQKNALEHRDKSAKLEAKYLFDYPQDMCAIKFYDQLSGFSHTAFKSNDLLSVLTLVISC